MTLPYNASNPFIPNNAEHRLSWPAYDRHVTDKMKSIREWQAKWVASFGLVPLRLKTFKHPRFKEPAFRFYTNATEGDAETFLDNMKMDHFTWSMFDSPWNMELQDMEKAEEVGLNRFDHTTLGYVTDAMEQYESYLYERELFLLSDVAAVIRQNKWDYSFEQRYDDCLLIVPDGKAAAYLKLTFS